MGVGLLSVGVALLAPASVLLAATLGVHGRADFVVATLVLAAAMVVGEAILLSLLRILTREALLAAQLAWLCAALAAWQRRGRPGVASFRPRRLTSLGRAARSHPLLAALLVVVVLALCLQAFLAIAVAPNEYDTLGYHLPRAAFWLQNHSALQFHPGEVSEEQVAPPNAELLIAWTMALSRSDAFAQLVQWLALLGLLAALVCGSRLAGIARPQAMFVAALFALYPVTLLEASTGQNDLVLAFFLTAAVVFAVSGLRQRARGRLLVASLAAGLAIGTKLDAALALPAVLLILLATWRAERPPRKLARDGVALFLAATMVLGSFVYIQNIVNTHTLTGFSGTPPGDFVRTNPLADVAHDAWNLLDAPGLPQPAWLADPLQRVAKRVFADVHGADFQVPPMPAIREESDPDTSAYGLLGLLLVAPLVVIALVRRRTPVALRVLALGAVSYFLACTLVLGYTDEDGRYLIPAFVLATPLLAPAVRHRAGALVALALVLLTLPGTLLHDVYKPLLASEGAPSILPLDRVAQQTIDEEFAPLRAPLRRLSALVGPHQALGFLNQEAFPEYLLFGQPLQRRLVGFELDQITARALRSDRLGGVFIAFANKPPCGVRECTPRGVALHVVRLGPSSYLVTAGAGRGSPLPAARPVAAGRASWLTRDRAVYQAGAATAR